MAFENLCMYCFEENGGADVCPHCGRDARAAVPQIQLLPGTLVYNDRFLIGRALGQDAGGIVYSALDTKRNVKIRIREYLPRESARRLNSGEVVPEPGAEDQFDQGMRKLRASVEGVEDPAKRHFFFEENGTGYIAQRKLTGVAGVDAGDDGERTGGRMALVVGIAALLVLGVAIGVIALVNHFANTTDNRTTAPMTTGVDVWQPPVSPTPTPYAAATFAAITDPTHSWMEFTNPDLNGNSSDFVTPTPAPTPEGGFKDTGVINSKSDPELIKKLQQLLIDLGWLEDGNVTGKYDDATRQAVKDFQQYMNDTYAIDPKLSVDGIAGPKTLEWLLRTDLAMKPTPTPAPVTPSPTQAGRVIDENSSPEEIKYVQIQLSKLGIIGEDDITGKYDKTTKKGILSFQQRVNDLLGYDALAEDGICGDRTLAYLDYYVQWWEDNKPTPAPTPVPTAAPTQQPTSTPANEAGDVIDENSSAASIRRVQEMLIAAGYLEGNADGVYGSKTRAAVEAFQQYINTNVDSNVQVTGSCDMLTREYLERYSQQSETTDAPAAEAPEITVTGYQDIVDGVYIVGKTDVKITWSAEGAQNYSVELSYQDGTLINKEASTPHSSLTLGASSLSTSEAYKFTVTAMNESGAGESASVLLKAAPEAAQPTESAPAMPVPSITVTGALSYADGVYNIGASGADIAWTADGAATYSIYLVDSASNIVFKNQLTTLTGYRIDATAINPGEKYAFVVVAIPEGADEADCAYASAGIMLDANAAPVTPAPTPSADITAPAITVTGALTDIEGVYYIGQDVATITWSAEGDVRAYSLYLTNSGGTVLTEQTETDKQSMTVDPATMTAEEIYTIRVVAIPEGGTEEHGKASQVQIALYNGQTPPPAQIGQVAISVSGHTSVNGSTYNVGSDSVTVSWSAEGSVTGYNVLVTDANGNTILDREAVTDTSFTVVPEHLTEDLAYDFSVTAIPENGTAADGNSASIVLVRPSAPKAGDIAITVSGNSGMDGDTYLVGNEGVSVSWASENAASYSVVLTDSNGTELNSAANVSETSLAISATGIEYGKTYVLTVTAHSASGDSADDKSASVKLAMAAEALPEVEFPVINVTGHIEMNEGVYYADTEDLVITWSAGNAAFYDIGLYDANGNEIGVIEGSTQTEMTISPDKLTTEVYTLSVGAVPASGDRNAAKYEIVLLAKYVVVETPAPAPSKPSITVTGYVEENGGVYYADETGLSISWASENAEKYDVAIVDANGATVKSAEGTTQTNLTIDTSALPTEALFEIKVTPIGANGTTGETASVTISRIAPEATPEPTPVPTPEPVEIGKPVFTVSGDAVETEGVYYIGASGANVAWAAENANAYDVVITNLNGETVTSVAAAETSSLAVDAASIPEGEVFTITVTGVAADGTKGESSAVKLATAKPEITPEPTPEPTSEPVEVGRPEIRVSGYDEEKDGIYYISGTATFEWSAENAASYNVVISDDGGNTVKSADGITNAGLTVKADDLEAGKIYTLTITGVAGDGTTGNASDVSFATAEEESKWPITSSSDAETITDMQKQLYSLGWITAADKEAVEIGKLDAITVQAVYDFQSYVIANELNPEISLINTADPVVDEVTLTMLFDAANPLYRPE